MTSSPTPAVLPDARALAIKYALPGHYDGISTFATQRGDADRKPYMLALIEALATPPASDAAVPAEERTDADLLRLIAKDHERLAPNAYHSAETLRQIADRLAAAPKVASEDRTQPDKDFIFDVLEALKPHFPKIAFCFARGTGGIERKDILAILTAPKVASDTDTLKLIAQRAQYATADDAEDALAWIYKTASEACNGR